MYVQKTRRQEPWRSAFGAFCSGLMVWTFVVAPAATSVAQDLRTPRPKKYRTLSAKEMHRITGSQTHAFSVAAASGETYPWEGNVGSTNTGNGNKITPLHVVKWTQRGGLPVDVTLYHSSQSNHNSELGQKWTFSQDIYLVGLGGGTDGSIGNIAVHWGDDTAYAFTNDGSNNFTPATGIHDSLVYNIDGSLTLTTRTRLSTTSPARTTAIP